MWPLKINYLHMYRFYTSLVLFLIAGTSCSFAQIAPGKYWIQFSDKKNSPYSISHPQAFLSQRAIDRRIKQSILINQQDLPVNPSYIDSILNTGAPVINTSKWFNAITIQTDDIEVLNAARSLPFVREVKAVKNLKTAKKEELAQPTEKFGWLAFSEKAACPDANQQALNYGLSFNQINMIVGDYLHDKGYKGEGMVIAVLDAGFYNVDTLPAFDSLWANNQILGTRDFVTGDATVFEDHPHGMNVLSIMGGYLEGQLIGTAPKASYWLLRSEDAAAEYITEEDNWVAAAEFADSVGADIINSSLGYTTFNDPSQNHTYTDMDGNTTIVTIGADYAASKGILVVNSAGNSGSSPWNYIGAPADGDSVLAVGAVDDNTAYASFSSKGPSYDGRVKPNVAAQGKATIVASTAGGIQSGSGTSFSSPVMAGMAACLWQAHPSHNNMQIFNAIQQSAHQYSDPDTLLGYGIPNFALASLISSGIDVEKLAEEQMLNAYPNPFNNSIEFIYFSPAKQDITIEIFDVAGRKVYDDIKSLRKNDYCLLKLDGLHTFRQGIYILSVSSTSGRFTQKLIKH